MSEGTEAKAEDDDPEAEGWGPTGVSYLCLGRHHLSPQGCRGPLGLLQGLGLGLETSRLGIHNIGPQRGNLDVT